MNHRVPLAKSESLVAIHEALIEAPREWLHALFQKSNIGTIRAKHLGTRRSQGGTNIALHEGSRRGNGCDDGAKRRQPLGVSGGSLESIKSCASLPANGPSPFRGVLELSSEEDFGNAGDGFELSVDGVERGGRGGGGLLESRIKGEGRELEAFPRRHDGRPQPRDDL